MKALTRKIVIALGVVLIALAVVSILYATTQTSYPTFTRGSHRGTYWSSYSYTFVNAQDTAIIQFNPSPLSMHSKTLQNVIIRTQRPGGATNNPISIAVRLLQSIDSVNWTTKSIGTDSTSWANLATDTVGNPASSNLGQTMSTYQFCVADTMGWWPYERIKIVGRAANTVGSKVKIDWIDQ